MFLKEIEIENFGIIREAHLFFSESNPVIGLIGRYESEENSGRSNRSGKSTFVEAMEYLLFGKARTRHHGKLINRTAQVNGEGMMVRGVYELQTGQEVEIIRTRTNDGKGTASVTGFEGSGWEEVNKNIAELIGFSHEENKNTSYFSQGDIHAFMKSTPKDKRQLLLDWLDQTRWQKRSEFAKQNSAKVSDKVNQLTTTLNALPEPEGDLDELEEQIEETRDAIKITESEIETVRNRLQNLENEYNEVAEQLSLEREKESILSQIKNTEEELENASGNARKKNDLLRELSSKRKYLKETKAKNEKELGIAREIFEVFRDRENELRIKHKALLSNQGTCPILREACNRVDVDNNRDLAGEIEKVFSERGKAEHEYDKIYDLKSNEVESIENSIGKIHKAISNLGNTDVERIEKRLDRLDEQLESATKELKPNNRNQTEIAKEKNDVSERMEELNLALGKYTAQIQNLKESVRRAKEHKERKRRIRKSLDEAKLDLGAWQYCAYMFGDRGIPNEFIKGAFETLESDVNYILSRMNCGLSVEFKPYRETKNFEPSCLACGNEFKTRERKCSGCGESRQKKRVEQLVLIIHDAIENVVSDFSLDSGGGQVLISFAVRLALLFFKIRQGNCEVPPIVLDEIVGMLDPVNRQAVIDVVLNILTEEYGVKQIFWISHNEEILDMIENGLVVTRFDSHSTVDWL